MIILRVIYHSIAFIKKIFYKLIFGTHVKFGKGIKFRKGFSLIIERKGLIEIGDFVFLNNYCSLNSLEKITIGEYCIFGENVRIYDHNHKFSDLSKPIMEQGYSTGPITIGKNCWIGSNVTILKGVTIGDNAVIGAGCLIYKDILENTIVKQQVRYSYTEYLHERLL